MVKPTHKETVPNDIDIRENKLTGKWDIWLSGNTCHSRVREGFNSWGEGVRHARRSTLSYDFGRFPFRGEGLGDNTEYRDGIWLIEIIEDFHRYWHIRCNGYVLRDEIDEDDRDEFEDVIISDGKFLAKIRFLSSTLAIQFCLDNGYLKLEEKDNG